MNEKKKKSWNLKQSFNPSFQVHMEGNVARILTRRENREYKKTTNPL